MENDLEAIRRDLNARPIETISGKNTTEEILKILSKYGIQNTNPTAIELWGTGSPLREFMHADDLADACVFLFTPPSFVFVSVVQATNPVNAKASPTHLFILISS